MMRWLPLALVLACGGGKSPAESVAPEVIDTGDTTTPTDTAEPVAPSSFEVKGVVVDREGTPVPDAIVMVGGREETMTSTAEDGSFSIWYEVEKVNRARWWLERLDTALSAPPSSSRAKTRPS